MAWSRKFYAKSTTVLIGAKETSAPLMPFMWSAILVIRLTTAGKRTVKRLSRMICNQKKELHQPALSFCMFSVLIFFVTTPFAGENNKAPAYHTPVMAAIAPEIETLSHVAKK